MSGRLLIQSDGPVLEALKRPCGSTIHLPSRNKDRPDRDRLALRFERFKSGIASELNSHSCDDRLMTKALSRDWANMARQ